MEYERYLEESFPCWQQQLKEKTQAARRKVGPLSILSGVPEKQKHVTKANSWTLEFDLNLNNLETLILKNESTETLNTLLKMFVLLYYIIIIFSFMLDFNRGQRTLPGHFKRI